MSSHHDAPTTRIATHTDDAIFVRGRDLVEDLMGRVSFTEMIFLHLTGTAATPTISGSFQQNAAPSVIPSGATMVMTTSPR